MELNCPACGSEEIYRGTRRRKYILIWYMSSFVLVVAVTVPVLTLPVLLVWTAFPLVLPFVETWRCRACGARLIQA